MEYQRTESAYVVCIMYYVPQVKTQFVLFLFSYVDVSLFLFKDD